MTRSYAPFWLAVVLFVVSPIGCDVLGDSPAHAPSGPILPLHVGNTWTLSATSHDDLEIDPIRITGRQTVAGREYFTFINVPGADTMHVRVDDRERLYRRSDDNEWLWLDPTVSDAGSYSSGPYTVTVRQDVTVETPTGTFENAIRFWFDIPNVIDEEHAYTVVPGIGFVQWSSAWFGPFLLTEYDIGPFSS